MSTMFPTRQEVIQKLLTSSHSSGDNTGISSSVSTASSQDDRRNTVARQRQWNDAEQFIEDNLREVYEKLPNLEKQIWGKLIVMEGNRRTAKAYLRHPLVTIDGSDVEFDGLRIGLARFDNGNRTNTTYEIFNDILPGVKIKIDPDGNVWAKRACLSPVFLKPLYRNRANDLFVIDQRPVKVFDIKRFKEVLVQELKQATPDRQKLEKCCLVCLKFSLDHYDLLRTPCWIVMIHLVAIELLNLVLPKDNELSSPSSSFTASPTRLNKANMDAGQKNVETAQRKPLPTPPPVPAQKPINSPPQHFFGHDQNVNKFTRLTECTFTPWQHPNPSLGELPPMPQGNPNFIRRPGRVSASLLDLRKPSECNNNGADQNWHFGRPQLPPPVPRRPHMGLHAGQRVFSMETLGPAPNPPFAVPARPPFLEPRALATQIERMQLQKWRSQDSGIASGSGSYGRK